MGVWKLPREQTFLGEMMSQLCPETKAFNEVFCDRLPEALLGVASVG